METPTPPEPGTVEQARHWRVEIWRSGEQVIAIEPQMVAGRDLLPGDEEAIREGARNLLAFIGDPDPVPSGGSSQERPHAQ